MVVLRKYYLEIVGQYDYLSSAFQCLTYFSQLYSLQFLGSTEVEQPKGTEVVRDAVRKLKVRNHEIQLEYILNLFA